MFYDRVRRKNVRTVLNLKIALVDVYDTNIIDIVPVIALLHLAAIKVYYVLV